MTGLPVDVALTDLDGHVVLVHVLACHTLHTGHTRVLGTAPSLAQTKSVQLLQRSHITYIRVATYLSQITGWWLVEDICPFLQ